ncbi:RNA-directed DNA polymerase-like protein [Gossypium australe]|uniref:RNA-directed DNA polymerase-like protein n=1 Tax=Gossypium australe TaxID=47621 RepID=A0A5B6VB11_9ROSI|nr:RNA-directed DNA polymerase-like protein [Gossypium australe]
MVYSDASYIGLYYVLMQESQVPSYLERVELEATDVDIIIEDEKNQDYGFNDEGILCFRGRYCVPKDKDLKQSILQKAHTYPKRNRMCQDLKKLY